MNSRKEVVLIGASVTHALLLQKFIDSPVNDIRITLLVTEPFSLLPTKLESYISGFCNHDDLHIDIRPLALAAEARLFEAKILQLDLENQCIHTNNRPPIKFDALSIQGLPNSKIEHIENAEQQAIFLYPSTQFLENWDALLKKTEHREGFFRICIVGSQDESIELLLAVQYKIQQNMQKLGFVMDGFEFHLITKSKQILADYSKKTQQRIFQILYERDIRIYPNTIVTKIDEESLYCSNGVTLNQEAVFLFTGITAPQWIANSELATDEQGFIKTNPSLQSISHSNIFASGPLVENSFSNKQEASVAVLQSKLLYQNILKWVQGNAPQTHRFKPDANQFITLGNGLALYSLPWFPYKSNWLYNIKSLRDQNLSAAAKLVLPTTIEAPLSPAQAGVRLNTQTMIRVLTRLQSEHSELKASDWLQLKPLSLSAKDTLNQFLVKFDSWLNDPYLFGKLAAENCLNHLYVTETEPKSISVIISMPPEQENFTEESLYHLLKGFYQIIQGTENFNGKVCQGTKLSITATISGLANSNRTKSHPQAGDCLILTKPLGSGLLLEADRQKRSHGSWISNVTNSMLKTNLQAVQTLQAFKTHQSFYLEEHGLLGELSAFLMECSLGMSLDLDAIPTFEGVQQLLKLPIHSAAYKSNQWEYQNLISNLDEVESLGLLPILFDPQVLGGVLSIVPEKNAAACVKELQELGYNHASVIGHCFSTAEGEPCFKIQIP